MMRSRCERDIRLFAYYFFEHLLGRPFGRMHRELFRLYRRSLNAPALESRHPRRLAIAAPRGAAKSTLKSLIFPIHALLYGRERYVVLLSATLKQARQRLRNIQSEFLANTLLRKYFPEALQRHGKATRDSLALNGARLDVYSAGTEVRGIAHRQWRPTLILLDDIEDSRAAHSPDRSERLYEWYNEIIENLGDTYTAIEIVGTILHPDSLLARLLKRPDFEPRIFRSIEQFADRADLWELWRARYTDLADPRREEAARLFFNRNRSEMLRGARVLWQAKEDYYALMVQMTTMGRAAFFKEKQNEPAAARDAFFDLARAARFRCLEDRLEILERETRSPAPPSASAGSDSPAPAAIPRASLRIAGFLDSAVGSRKNQGDYAAVATVGMDSAGRFYLLDLWMRRAAPTAQIAAIFHLHEKWNYTLFGIETNCFQQLLLLPIEEERKRRKEAGAAWQLPIREVHHAHHKETRIAGLEPLLSNGWLCLAQDLPDLFWSQMESFPQGRHDDALDALEGAVSLLRTLSAPSRSGPRRDSARKLANY